jgi:heat shock protein HslJ
MSGYESGNAFQKKFETMTKYSIEGHFLTLSDDKGNSMKFVAADWD